jgi:poly(3-hydroxybutyrate) depolymerase
MASTMYQINGARFSNPAFLWPAVAATLVSEMAARVAMQFGGMAFGPDEPIAAEPGWATPHTIVLELETVRLRDFSVEAKGSPVLICAPLALHGATVVDLVTGHSLVAALRRAGVRRLFVTDWRSATGDMRFLGIDDYLSALNVAVDQIGGKVDLVGLCQGGWMAVVYAARFPAKVRKLVLAGAPIDIKAAPSALSTSAEATPLAIFHELVRDEGLVLGRNVRKFWGGTVTPADVRQVLQIEKAADNAALTCLEALFRDWYSWTVDLPGVYFLEVVEKLFKRNEIATGSFVALGQRVDLTTVKTPMFLLAARDDELVAVEQLFATQRLVSTPPGNIRKAIVPCRHLGLFVGKMTLQETWPKIARWIRRPSSSYPKNDAASGEAAEARVNG